MPQSFITNNFNLKFFKEQGQVIILFADLDLAEWAVVYSCSHHGAFRVRYEVAMAMTRTRGITPWLRQSMKALMVGQGFRIGDHHPVDQGSC